MASCFDDLFGGGAARVVMIGADVPHLGASAVAAVFAALDTADVVLTPTRDGGYCLVGQHRPHDLFRGIEMGTERVFAQTMERIAGLGLRASIQAETFDIDEWEDVVELRRLLDSGAVHLPNVAAAMGRAFGVP
jgi:glycosyltransferase A (GT-A) superfamily protein (DUF2064 family)